MYLTRKSNIVEFGENNPITVIRKGFLRYEAVQNDGLVVARGLRLRRYYNPYTGKPGSGALPGRIMRSCSYWSEKEHRLVDGTWEYFLKLENPKTFEFDVVAVWR